MDAITKFLDHKLDKLAAFWAKCGAVERFLIGATFVVVGCLFYVFEWYSIVRSFQQGYEAPAFVLGVFWAGIGLFALLAIFGSSPLQHTPTANIPTPSFRDHLEKLIWDTIDTHKLPVPPKEVRD